MSDTPTMETPIQTPPRIHPGVPHAWLRLLAVVLAIAGWWVSFHLYRASGGAPHDSLFDLLCSPAAASAGWDCASVLASKHGSIRLSTNDGAPRLPTAALGLYYFAFIGLWYVFVGPPTRDRRWYHLVIGAILLMGVWSSITYVRIMAVELRQWCAWCLVVHAINGLLALLTIIAWPWRTRGDAYTPHPSPWLAAATGAACALAVLAQLSFSLIDIATGQLTRFSDAYRKIVEDPAYIAWNYARQPRVEIPWRDDDLLLGDANAPNTVVIFSDFQCPRCSELHDILEKVVTAQPVAVRVAQRNFPLDRTCNPHLPANISMHPAACRAARAFEAARAVGGPAKAAAFGALLFERQARLDDADVEAWAAEVGLDVAALRTAATDARAAARIDDDIELGKQFGLDATGVPVVYVNGRRFDGWRDVNAWRTLLAGQTSP